MQTVNGLSDSSAGHNTPVAHKQSDSADIDGSGAAGILSIARLTVKIGRVFPWQWHGDAIEIVPDFDTKPSRFGPMRHGSPSEVAPPPSVGLAARANQAYAGGMASD